MATTAKALVADAHLIRMTEFLANMSAAVGDDEAQAKYRSQHAALRDEFATSWITNGSTLANRTQTAYALALHFGLLPADEAGQADNGTVTAHGDRSSRDGSASSNKFVQANRAAAAATLRQIVAENDHLVRTGFADTPALGPAL